MSTKKTTPKIYPQTVGVRLDDDDKKHVSILQKLLSRPGIKVDRSKAIKAALRIATEALSKNGK